VVVAPEQAGALPQLGGLARCGHGGTQESRRRVSLPHALKDSALQSDTQAGSPRAGQGSPEPGAGTEYFVVPGGPIPRDVGDELITMPDIRPVDSGLFPNGDGQTWELVK
jgi:hypothetical protein